MRVRWIASLCVVSWLAAAPAESAEIIHSSPVEVPPSPIVVDMNGYASTAAGGVLSPAMQWQRATGWATTTECTTAPWDRPGPCPQANRFYAGSEYLLWWMKDA